MIFTTFSFLGFFALALLYLRFIKNNKIQKWGLLAGSYFFYAQWDWRFLGLLLWLTLMTFYCSSRMRHMSDQHIRRRWLALQVTLSLVTLGFFKYANFFVDTLKPLVQGLGLETHTLNVILPIGISFIVFEVISYAVDVYRGDTPFEESLLDFSILVAFFPHLISGPIIKPKAFLPQLKNATSITSPNMSAGMQLFLWGLMKKVLVADRVAPFVDVVFQHPLHFNSLVTWLAVVAYAVQIYGDFSGYTDMAIGAARMMGYDIPRNFNLPYLSLNITDFWRRWHISLSSWLRDYLYIPLGGSRKGLNRTYINLAIVMLLGGLWHGASWNFVLWGGIHGSALAIHKFFIEHKRLKAPSSFTRNALSWALTIVFVLTAWVPFRSTDWHTSMAMLRNMYTFTSSAPMHWISNSLLFALPALVIADIGARNWHLGIRLRLSRFSHQLAFFMLLFSVLVMAPPAASPFIYFQF